MTTILSDVFSNDDIAYLLQCQQTLSAKEKINNNTNVVYFNVPITETIRNSLENNLSSLE